LQTRLATETKKEIRRVLEAEDLKDEVHLERMIRDLEKSIKRSRNRDLGIEEEEQQEEMSFHLLDVPNEELDEAGLKEKRHQQLMKSNVEARARAKAEKEREKARIEEEERLDREKRENDFENWIAARRTNRQVSLHLPRCWSFRLTTSRIYCKKLKIGNVSRLIWAIANPSPAKCA
jgi:actin-related protein 5